MKTCKGCNRPRLFMCQHVIKGSEPINCGYCIECCPERKIIHEKYPESKKALVIIPY